MLVKKYYLSVPTGNNGIDISAEIHIPGVGDFNTSSTGTATKNGPRGEVGSTFISPKFVHVNSIPAVDYTRSENFRIELGYEEYRNSFKWETRIDKDNNFTYQDNGKVWRQVVKLFPVKDVGNQTFKHCSINSDESTELKDGQISLGRVNWKEWSYDGYKNGISGPGNADWMKIYPFAVIQSIKRGAKKNNTQVNVWFTPRKSNNYDFRLDGNFVLKDEKHTYLAFHKTTILNDNFSNETPIIYIYKFILPDLPESKEHEWVSIAKSPEITVTDYFGNTAKFKLLIDAGEYFDKPGIQPAN